MSSLTYQHLPKLGDKAVMIPSNAPHVKLPYAPPSKRVFPPEHVTHVPDFNKMRPCPGVYKNESAKPSNGYHNGLPNSQSLMETHTKESGINNAFDPPIDHRLKCVFTS